MAEYHVLPVSSTPKSGTVKKYSPKDEDRGGNSRYQPEQKEKKSSENKRKDSFTSLMETKIHPPKEQNHATMMSFTFNRGLPPPMVFSYRKAKILSLTLAHEINCMEMAE